MLTLCAGGCREDVEIAAAVSEAEANRIVVQLRDHGVDSARLEKQTAAIGRFSVHVTRRDEPAARKIVVRNDLLEPQGAALTAAFEKGGLIPSATAERARLMAGLGASLARTLETVDGVLRVRVHVMLPDKANDMLAPTKEPPAPTASVLIVHAAGPLASSSPSQPTANVAATTVVRPIAADDVKRLVAAAVEGLELDAVTVVYSTAPARDNEPIDGADSSSTSVLSADNRVYLVVFLTVVGVLATAVAVLTLRRRRELAL